ncbi:MAG: biotin/lipoyl-binding protein [Bacteroidales bacterium]|nr:biotin/lipoyl-binding protein [Bacteroidales bacterium]
MNKFKITIDEQPFDVTVNVTDHNKASVEVNGISYDVVYEKKNAPAAPVARKAAIPSAPHMQTPNPKGNTPVAPVQAASKQAIKSPLPGTIVSVNVKEGDQVKKGDVLIVMEAMKMENNIMAGKDGQVKAIYVSVGQTVAQDDALIDLA